MASKIPEIIFGQVFDRVLDTVTRPSVPVTSGAEKAVAQAVAKEVAPIVVNAQNAEPWYQSRVILGALVAIISSIAGAVGIVIDEDTRQQFVTLIPVVVSTIGSIYALYGRIVGASKKPLGQ